MRLQIAAKFRNVVDKNLSWEGKGRIILHFAAEHREKA
jgi:hypothetical protein